MPLRASASSAQKLRLAERRALGRALDLDDPARAGHHEIGVGAGLRILGIVEVEHRRALHDAAGDRGDVVDEHVLADHRAGAHPGERVVERHPGAGDRGGARAAVGLEHVAVDGDLALAERLQVDHGAQRAADQALDLLRAAALLARASPRAACARAWRAAACRIRP